MVSVGAASNIWSSFACLKVLLFLRFHTAFRERKKRHQLRGAFCVTHICTRTQQVALLAPSLWATIYRRRTIRGGSASVVLHSFDTSNIQTLNVTCHNEYDEEGLDDVHLPWMPNLQTFYVRGCVTWGDLANTLTFLSIEGIRSDDLSWNPLPDILLQALTLEELHLEVDFMASSRETPIPLPNLKRLWISTETFFNGGILNVLQAPSLHEVEITSNDCIIWDTLNVSVFPALNKIIPRTSVRVLKTLYDVYPCLDQLATTFPNITRLEIPANASNMFKFKQDCNRRLWPKIEELTVTGLMHHSGTLSQEESEELLSNLSKLVGSVIPKSSIDI